MPRSELTNVLRRARELHDYVQALTDDERNYLLDLLAPEPEAKPTKKKASKKAGKSRRAQGLSDAVRGNLQRRVPTATDDEFPDLLGNYEHCTFKLGSTECGAVADANIHHLESADGYHPFQPVQPAARQSSRNGAATSSTASSEAETDAATVAARAAGEGELR